VTDSSPSKIAKAAGDPCSLNTTQTYREQMAKPAMMAAAL
jgi:hypothetical protein